MERQNEDQEFDEVFDEADARGWSAGAIVMNGGGAVCGIISAILTHNLWNFLPGFAVGACTLALPAIMVAASVFDSGFRKKRD